MRQFGETYASSQAGHFHTNPLYLSATSQEGHVQRLLICDLDVHQGDGTAEILRDSFGGGRGG